MARRVLASAVVLVALVIAFPGVSGAHNVSIGTKVSKSKLPRGALRPGERVIVFGRVGAIDAVCNSLVSVELMRMVPGADRVLESDVTDAEGEYYFLRRPRGDQRVYVRFAGFMDVTAGHIHTCGGSVSRGFLLNVRR
jgi:hypothetical protein